MERSLPIARREAWTLAGVLVVALILRVAYILGQRGDLLFEHPVVDEELYVTRATSLAGGHGAELYPWFQPPGLTYFLALVFRAFGPGLLAPRLVQALVSTASCGLAYLVARRLLSHRVALATAAICAVHGVLVFESYELLPVTWMLAADLFAVWLLLRAGTERTPKTALFAGVALGVSAVFGPTVLPFALFAAVWLRRPALVGALAAGVALPIAPVTWANWQNGHELVLISTNGGINFYLGNNDRYDDTLAIRPGEHWKALDDEPIHDGAVGHSARSAWFFRRGLAFWEEHPARAVALALRKVYLFFDGPEIPRDTDVYALRSDSWLLSALVTRGPPWLPDGLLVPLALLGATLCAQRWRELLPLYAFVALQALTIAAFFVTSRYRVPSLPALALFACAGVDRLASGSRSLRAAGAAGFAALALCLNVATHESSVSYAAELDFYRGLALQRYLHSPAQAVDYFRRASTEDPRDGRIWFELGNALDASGRNGEAIEAWLRAGEADPWDPRGRRRASVGLARQGRVDDAIAALRADIDSRAHPEAFYAPDHLNVALMLAQTGRDAEAMSELAAAQAADPAWFRWTIAGFARAVQSNPDIGSAFRDAVASASRGALALPAP